MNTISLRSLIEYARCPLRYWWVHRANIIEPMTARTLPQRSVSAGITQYYRRQVESPFEGVVHIWKGWFDQWQCGAEAKTTLDRYAATVRASNAQNGAVQLHQESMRRQIDMALAQAPVVLTDDYSLTEAIHDAIAMSLTYEGPERGRARAAVPFTFQLTDGIAITGEADIVLEDAGGMTIEIHDYEQHRPHEITLAHRLDVIVLAHAIPGDNKTVVYRHMPTGYATRLLLAADINRLLPVVSAVVRGIQCGCFLPRMAAEEAYCWSCPYVGLCITEDDFDVLDNLDVTLFEQSIRE